jgi:hypothetical protein
MHVSGGTVRSYGKFKYFFLLTLFYLLILYFIQSHYLSFLLIKTALMKTTKRP